MTTSYRVAALIAYLPVIGWLFVAFFRNKDEFAKFHLRQSVGLFAFLLVILIGWGVFAWLLAWLPFALLVGVALFSLVIFAFLFGVLAWLMGVSNALRGRVAYLPVFGRMAGNL